MPELKIEIIDRKPYTWIRGARKTKNIIVGDVFGLTADCDLVQPFDPRTINIGVVVLVFVDRASNLIFTDGDVYRKCGISGSPSDLCDLYLSLQDRNVIRAAIKHLLD